MHRLSRCTFQKIVEAGDKDEALTVRRQRKPDVAKIRAHGILDLRQLCELVRAFTQDGDSAALGDVWTEQDPKNDQSASAFRADFQTLPFARFLAADFHALAGLDGIAVLRDGAVVVEATIGVDGVPTDVTIETITPCALSSSCTTSPARPPAACA